MAHYRKLDVDGTPYEYNVGKSFVKIKGIGEFPKEQVGQVHNYYMTEVKPHHVVDFIRKTRKP